MKLPSDPSRRGLVIIAVLLILVMLTAAATSLVLETSLRTQDASARAQKLQDLFYLDSAIESLLTLGEDQRTVLIEGGTLDVPDEWTLFEVEGGRVVVRLRDDGDVESVQAEGAKFPVTLADEEGLLAMGFSSGAVSRILELPMETVNDTMLSGVLEGEDRSLAARTLTMWSFDPEVISGSSAPDLVGIPRLVSSEFENGEPVPSGVPSELELQLTTIWGNTDPTDRKSLVRTADLDALPAVLDVLRFSAGEFAPGRIDLSRAPAEVLAGLPGVTSGMADRIVLVRESIPADQRGSLAWLFDGEVLTRSELVEIADFIGARSMQWRIRCDIGVLLDEDSADERMDLAGSLDVVLDLSGSSPRIAWVRRITSLLAPEPTEFEEPEEMEEPEPVVEESIGFSVPPRPTPRPRPPSSRQSQPQAPAEPTTVPDPRRGRWGSESGGGGA